MTRKKTPLHLAAALAAALLATGTARATIIAPAYVAGSSTPDTFNVATPDKLVDNSGMIVPVVSGTSLADALAATHIFDGNFQQSWVTNGVVGDYFASKTPPVLVFDLGQDLEVRDLLFWQYQNNGGNGTSIGNWAKNIEARFNLAAAGNATFAGAATNVALLNYAALGGINKGQQTTLAAPVVARYVQLRFIDNYFGQPGITGGGDRVGIGEFRVNVTADPEIVVPSTINVSGNDSERPVVVPVSNQGSSLPLNITGLQVTGTDAAMFTIDTVASPAAPLVLAPGAMGNIQLTFDPAGVTGAISASLVVISNDPFATPNTIPITGLIRDPWIATPATAGAGVLANDAPAQFTVTVQNLGAANPLEVTGAFLSGPDASYFTVDTEFDTPLVIAPGTSAPVTLTFDPAGEFRTFTATLELDSNDITQPIRLIPLTAELDRDPQISAPVQVFGGPFAFNHGPGGVAIQISNAGSTNPLTLPLAPLVTGGDAEFFTVTNHPAAIAQGSSGTINLTFTPPAGGFGLFSTTLEVESDDLGQPFTQVEVVVEVLPPVRPGGLVAWWPLDDSADPGNEASGNNLDATQGGTGTLTATAGANSNTGGALDFDGAVRLTVPHNSALNPESYTVVGWASPDSAAGIQSFITSRFDQVATTGNTYGYIFYIINGQWDFWNGTPPPGGWATQASGAPVAGAWQHVAISYDATTKLKTVHVNGVAVSSATATAPYQRNLVRDLHLGAGQDLGDGFFFNGKLDDIAVFNSVLSTTDINTIRNTGVAGFLAGGGAYDAWESDNGIAGAGAGTDSDRDGIPNGIEFVIGGDPSGPGSDSNRFLPTVTVDGSYLNFEFRRSDDSAAYDPFVEYGSTLVGWTAADAGVPVLTPVIIDEDDDYYGTDLDRVTVRIPRALATGNKVFARLRIDLP